ncbi:nitrogen regulation protein NR(I) [Echinimonas agarilytica]|uniref:DNA-binding transcriptional regulator NtrC n=1 Tax=Echinimonas agarilytica TaxID=1215918 RepID=A0AA42B8L5_9GAMM|nr:nitrogen regulation protein NR(I) [Echinimonas agarilytica]MCM2681022.1 nitrogen regulation protein NR(I) [Echinimonas agarilytica]
MKNASVWIIDDDSSIRWVLERALGAANISCQSFGSAEDVLTALNQSQPQVMISDVRMGGMDGLAMLKQVKDRYDDIPVIIMTAHSDLDSAVTAFQSGAFEYLPKPFDIDDAVTLVNRALTHSNEQRRLKTGSNALDQNIETPEIIGEAPAMQEVFRAIGRLSRSSISVLINGGSGTGKELVANALHKHSPRASKSFIALNMAAIPKDLIESELFGHEKGAFTGAGGPRQGRFEQADGGTLFLDEIGDMPMEVQTRLLRVLSDGQFYRVGGHSPISVDVRIIAATHQNLEHLVQKNQFREDLFHRLNVIRVHLPSLAERRIDIARLAQHFLQRAAIDLGVEAKTLHADTERYMSQLPWPGNVRQLENTCRWLTVMASSQEVLVSDLPPELLNEPLSSSTDEDGQIISGPTGEHAQQSWKQLLQNWADSQLSAGHSNILEEATAEFERVMLRCALNHTGGHKQEAARRLGWGRNTLTRKLKELDM